MELIGDAAACNMRRSTKHEPSTEARHNESGLDIDELHFQAGQKLILSKAQWSSVAILSPSA
jgi:hypothetical protein